MLICIVVKNWAIFLQIKFLSYQLYMCWKYTLLNIILLEWVRTVWRNKTQALYLRKYGNLLKPFNRFMAVMLLRSPNRSQMNRKPVYWKDLKHIPVLVVRFHNGEGNRTFHRNHTFHPKGNHSFGNGSGHRGGPDKRGRGHHHNHQSHHGSDWKNISLSIWPKI